MAGISLETTKRVPKGSKDGWYVKAGRRNSKERRNAVKYGSVNLGGT